MELATIQRISKVDNHPNADRLDVVEMEGMAWRCIVGRGDFQVGDACIFIPIDTEVPKAICPFPTDREYERIRTIKLRGEFSQGLVLPMSVLVCTDFEHGQDVAELLGVRKYEKPEPRESGGPNQASEKTFPSHLVDKTDEMNLLSYPWLLEEMRGLMVEVTLKLDGSSGTFINDEGNFLTCSRTTIKLGDGGYWGEIARKYDLENKMLNGDPLFYRNFAIQGEVVGPKIQKNKMGLDERDFYVFGMRDTEMQTWLNRDDVGKMCEELNLKRVPVVCTMTITDEDIAFFQELANKQTYDNGHPAEGIVVRPIEPRQSPRLGRQLSFKVINQNYGE